MSEPYTREVLDNYGRIVLIDWMGDEQRVIQMARSCWQSKGNEESDRKLLAKLLEMGHGNPFEHVVFTWHVRLPIFVARQWMRHRIGTFTELSLRYCEAKMEWYTPDLSSPQELSAEATIYNASCHDSFMAYLELLDRGLSREQARGVLPLAIYTEFYWTVNCRSFMHWLDLRYDKSAQWEHREYAKQAFNIWSCVMPVMAGVWAEHKGLTG